MADGLMQSRRALYLTQLTFNRKSYSPASFDFINKRYNDTDAHILQ